MEKDSSFLLDLSVLSRNISKYFDKVLAQYEIGSGQLVFLLAVNENEGITMQEVTRIGEVDKGTTSKSINKLIEQGYIQSIQDENDRRVKRLYTTEKASSIMTRIYEYRNECRKLLSSDVDFNAFEKSLCEVCENSRKYLEEDVDYQGLRIGGMQKMTLLDYPGKVAATIFTGGCNFKCPFCHNKDLVFLPDNYEFFEADSVLEYLEKRKGLLDGVCISGGEPLIQKDLLPFIEEIKKMGYLIKLDTNGYYPNELREILASGMIDYVAMDIKNSKEKYAETIGLKGDLFNLSRIEESVKLLMEGDVDYEFRTTIIQELHTEEDMKKIGSWIRGCKAYYLQQYMDSGNIIQPGYHALGSETMKQFQEVVSKDIPNVQLRGVKEG